MRKWLWRDGWIGWLVRKIYSTRWKIIEHIPDDEKLWRAVHKKDQLYENGDIKPAFFRDKTGLSCDLARFSTVERSRRGYNPPPWPDAAGLVEIRVTHARAAGSDVRHKPISGRYPNYSHSQFTEYLTPAQAKEICRQANFPVKPRRAELP